MATEPALGVQVIHVPPRPSIPHVTINSSSKPDGGQDKLKTISQNSFISKSCPEVCAVTPIRVSSVGSMVCRICQTNTAHENLISPCNCKGTLAYVHLSCLERWLNQSSRSYCELCMYRFNAVQTQRYGLWEGLRMWIQHPRNRTHVQSDFLISVLLTIVTGGLITVCLLGMQYFVLEGKKVGISKPWTTGAVSLFLGVMVIGYIATIYLLVKDQFVPWYNWWKNTVDVKLMLTPSTSMIHPNPNHL